MPVLVPRKGTDFLGNKVYFDYSPPLFGGRGFAPHHVVAEVERVLKAYKIDLPRYYDTYGNAPAKTRSRFRTYKRDIYHAIHVRNSQRGFESRLFRKSFKRKGWFYRKRYGYSTRRSSRYY